LAERVTGGLPSFPHDNWLVSLPKAEVHVHLEGTLGARELVVLAEQEGQALPRPETELFEVGNLADFLELLDWGCALVRTQEQLSDAAYRLSQREAGSGVLYADVIVNPTHWRSWRGRLGDMVEALDVGFTRAERDGYPPVGLCLSLLRQQSAQEAMNLVRWMASSAPPRVVALSIDGNEAAAGPTAQRFAPAFAAARAAGFHCAAHAGESSGPEGVWDAIDVLGVERVDHGVRAVEDAALVGALAERGLPLGMCPTSNLKLGVCVSYEAHPLERLRRAGVKVSVNSDDPALLGTSLELEYQRVGEPACWGIAEYLQVAGFSIDAAFCPERAKASMRRQLAAFAAASRGKERT